MQQPPDDGPATRGSQTQGRKQGGGGGGCGGVSTGAMRKQLAWIPLSPVNLARREGEAGEESSRNSLFHPDQSKWPLARMEPSNSL